jgi:hypothetical protein
VCAPLLDIGDDCWGEGCKAGLHCEGGVCTPRRAIGSACDFVTEFWGVCEEGAVCSGDPGSCVPPKKLGQPCELDGVCESGFCSVDSRTCSASNASETRCSGYSF